MTLQPKHVYYDLLSREARKRDLYFTVSYTVTGAHMHYLKDNNQNIVAASRIEPNGPQHDVQFREMVHCFTQLLTATPRPEMSLSNIERCDIFKWRDLNDMIIQIRIHCTKHDYKLHHHAPPFIKCKFHQFELFPAAQKRWVYKSFLILKDADYHSTKKGILEMSAWIFNHLNTPGQVYIKTSRL